MFFDPWYAGVVLPSFIIVGLMLIPFSRIFVMLAPKQCNEFAFAVRRTNQLQPWMETETRMSERYAIEHGRMYVTFSADGRGVAQQARERLKPPMGGCQPL